MEKLSVLIVDKALNNSGILANASLVIGLSAGKLLPEETFGAEAIDGDGSIHHPLTNQAHFVRKAGQSKMKTLRKKFKDSEDVLVVDYTEDAAPSDYQHYLESLGKHSEDEISYRAMWVYGDREIVEPLTKNLSKLS